MKIGTTAIQLCCAAALLAISTVASAELTMIVENPSSQTTEPVDASALESTGIGSSLPIPAVVNPDGTIPDQYIVTLKPILGTLLKPLKLEQQIQAMLALVGGGEVLAIYDTVFSGFAVRMPAVKAKLLAALPQVAAVEPNQLLTLQAVQQNPPSWGLDRIDQMDPPLDQTYVNPDSQGAGAHVYIIDSGINPHHSEFTGRVSTDPNQHIWVKTVASSPWDCNGHGTHVASTAAGTQAGVAKKATLHVVRVTNCQGQMTSDGVIAAMNWVAKYAQKPAVANMSLGTTAARSTAWETAARGMVNADVAVAVAAGNQDVSACTRSPAAEPRVLTVGATSEDDQRGYVSGRWYSNYGSCLDLFAPGTNIVGAYYGDNTSGAYMTGTSMASPHVAGALALWRARFPTTSATDIQNLLLHYYSTPNRVSGAGTGSPNRLLYIDKAPKATFTYDCNGTQCTFDGTASTDERPAGLVYQWNFGDGTTASGSTAVHTYSASGLYSVSLVLVDDLRQPGNTAQQEVIVLP